MADPLYELLTPYFDALDTPSRPLPTDQATSNYLNRLTSLSLSELTTSESESLTQSSQSLFRSLQALSKRSYKNIISSATHLSNLSASLPALFEQTTSLHQALPALESSASRFAEKYRKGSDVENESLKRRRKALLLSENADRISSLLDLPTLLSTTISSSSQASTISSNVNYTSALDLHAHIKRLTASYPSSPLISSISTQAEREMKLLTTNLIASLQTQGMKLAVAMRTIGCLRRVAPELDESMQLQKDVGKLALDTNSNSRGSSLGALFLVCRLANLIKMLDALEPLRELADQETAQREKSRKSPKRDEEKGSDTVWANGQQTERYLKRYIETFREQSFAMVSMYCSIFPGDVPFLGTQGDSTETPISLPKAAGQTNALLPLPSPLATFPSHLIEMLFETLSTYLPNVRDRAARDSLMTQILYCAGSLGRLGGDFSMMLTLLDDGDEISEAEEDAEWNWVEVMKQHRVQASRLELLASGVSTGRNTAMSPK